MAAQIILASASPRRRELLGQIGVQFTVCPVDINEMPHTDEQPTTYVQRVAAEKSAAAATNTRNLPILAADTTVVLESQIMGKPGNLQDAMRMLRQLSGRTHQVYTAVSLRGKSHHQALSVTEVTFRELTEHEIEHYWQSGESADKAGSYAIQGLGAVFVQSIKGSFSGVMGLPIFETAEILANEGILVFK
jgi:septum formation protein